ncbi:unnamed protein product, partial [Oppiella nova]
MEENSEKLDKAIKSLDLFKELLNKSDLQTRQMSVILDNFSERLSKLETTIQPVYRETGNLQTIQQNIVSTLERLDYVIKFYTVANEVDTIITTGPNDSLETYLKNLDRLKEAIDYFELNNPESPELMNVSALYEKGGNCIEREFRQLLSRHSVAVPPILIYDLVHEEDSQDTGEADKTILEQLPGLRDHQKSCSGGIQLSGQPMSHSSPAMGRKSITGQMKESSAVRRTPKSIQQAHYSFEVLHYGPLQNPLFSELKLMNGIIRLEHQRPIFSRLVYTSLDSVVGEGELLANRVKKCIARQDFPSALCLFPILRHQASMRHNFDLLFDGCNLEVQSKFQGLVVALQTTISRITDIQSLENSSDKNRLAFAQYITRVLASLGLTLQNKSEFYSDPHLKAIFKLNNTHYILKTLRKSNLLNIVHMYNREIESVYEEQMLDSKRIYSQSWSRVLHYVLEMDKPFSQQRTLPEMNNMANMRLKDKDRQNIKDKFASSVNSKTSDQFLCIPRVAVQTPSAQSLRSRSLSVPSMDENILLDYNSVSKSVHNRVNERLITLSSRHLSFPSPPESSQSPDFHFNNNSEALKRGNFIGKGHHSQRESTHNYSTTNSKQLQQTAKWRSLGTDDSPFVVNINHIHNNERSDEVLNTKILGAIGFDDNIVLTPTHWTHTGSVAREVYVYVCVNTIQVSDHLLKMEENSEKLDKAIKSLDLFKELLNKSDLQTRQMSVILDNFSERLSKLETTI